MKYQRPTTMVNLLSTLFIVEFVVTYIALSNAQVATLCRSNEVFLSCGACQRTCSNPAPACAAVCRVGCYCPGDLVRNSSGHCIPYHDCPVTNLNDIGDTDEPIPIGFTCPENEVYEFCGICNKTCDNPNPICPAQCNRGCYCMEGLLRNSLGKCVKPESCPKTVDIDSGYNEGTSEFDQIDYDNPFKRTCPDDEVYEFCGICNKTCDNPNPICPAQCNRGCYCKEGLLRNSLGKCVKPESCPKTVDSDGGYNDGTSEFDQIDYDNPFKRTCPDDEVYEFCGICNKTCDNPNPICNAQCNRGCYCKEGLLRNILGKCVKPESCPKTVYSDGGYNDELFETQTYLTVNEVNMCPGDEVYQQCGLCHKTCDNPNPICPAQCIAGCFCTEGLLRDADGRCVMPQQCQISNLVKRETKDQITKCGHNETFTECGSCTKTCRTPVPEVCTAVCQTGCYCNEGYVRDDEGICIPLEDCPVGTCKDVNEEYSCKYPCEEFCSNKPCAIRSSRCIVGCYCKDGYIREDTNGMCVKLNECVTRSNSDLTV